ncbi:MAG: protoporphyrinogen oxidase [Planctomycetota bacterium]
MVVIGGGITGLTAAHRLQDLGRSVVLIESSDRLGGVIRSEWHDGMLLEHGPFSVMVRCGEFVELLDELRLAPIESDASGSRARFVLRDGQLRRVPTSPGALLSSSLVSMPAKLDLLRRMMFSPVRRQAGDVSMRDVATRRLGTEPAERLISPACVGIFAAGAEELSADACLPTLSAADHRARSTLGLARSMRAGAEPARRRMMVSFDSGLASLVTELSCRLDGVARRGTTALSIEPGSGARRYRVLLSEGMVECDAVVVAAGANVTARLVGGLEPSIVRRLQEIRHASLGVVHLAFDRDLVDHPCDGFGFLIPRSEPETAPVLGVIWPGSVFPFHVPDGRVLLRAMVGGTRWPTALRDSCEAIVQRTLSVLQPLLGVRGAPSSSHVSLWPDSVPVYSVGHAERVRSILELQSRHPGVMLAGSWVCGPSGGVGVNDRVRLGRRAAEIVATEDPTPRSTAFEQECAEAASTRQEAAVV